MPFDLLSWIFVALLLIGVVGLVGTIIGDINRSVSKPTANALRVILIVLGLGAPSVWAVWSSGFSRPALRRTPARPASMPRVRMAF